MTLNEELAAEVMGWQKLDNAPFEDWGRPDGMIIMQTSDFRPDSDLNQARMVSDKSLNLGLIEKHDLMVALERVTMRPPEYAWFEATPEQICQAVLMAVREARK